MRPRAGTLPATAAALVLLMPSTVVAALVALLSYPAYPILAHPLQVVFDAGMIVQLAGLASAWRLVLLRACRGRAALGRAHPVWMVPIGAAAAVGLVGGVIAVEHAFTPRTAGSQVGYALLGPAVLLAPLWWLLRRERRPTPAGDSS